MRSVKKIGAGAVTLALIGILFPQLVYASHTPVASPNSPSQQPVRDLELTPAGILQGYVVDLQGTPQTGQDVVIVQQGRALAKTTSNARGQFGFGGVSGGVYEIQTVSGTSVYRVWMPETAPPSATANALVVNGTVVRGNGWPALRFLGNPWVLGGIVAAAIAIPLALDDDNAS